MTGPTTRLQNLRGTWTRSLLSWPDGRKDTTSRVTWLQGPTFYADLRQPAELALASRPRCLRDLQAADVDALARQEGFAGIFLQRADCFEWTRMIDFQPVQLYSDCGTLVDLGDVMIEEGRDIPYIEHWHRDPRAAAPAAAVELRDVETGCRGVLVRAGDVFMLARDRAVSLQATRHLSELVRAAPSLDAAQDLVDCELSVGVVSSGWRIERSSLPWRGGMRLEPRLDGTHLVTSDVAPDGEIRTRLWTIVREDGRLADLFSTASTALEKEDGMETCGGHHG